MNYENSIDRTLDRFDQSDRDHQFVSMIDAEIRKTKFHFQARQFIQSVIKQRQLLINHGDSRKNAMAMLGTIDLLKVNLGACPDQDHAMSRFFLKFEEEIRCLIPGQPPSKRFERFAELREKAREIRNHHQSIQ